MSNLKVLSLDYWMKPDGYIITEADVDNCAPNKINPIMNRDGYYYKKGNVPECWFEYKGQAREYISEYFLYDLKLLNHKPIPDNVLKILKSGKIQEYLPKNIKDLLYFDSEYKSIKNVQRDSKKRLIKLLKKKKNART